MRRTVHRRCVSAAFTLIEDRSQLASSRAVLTGQRSVRLRYLDRSRGVARSDCIEDGLRLGNCESAEKGDEREITFLHWKNFLSRRNGVDVLMRG